MNMTAMKIVVSFVAHVAMVVAARIVQQANTVMAMAVYAAGVVHLRMAVGVFTVLLVVMRIKSKGEYIMNQLKRLMIFMLACGLIAWGIDWVSYPTSMQPIDFSLTYLYVCFWAYMIGLLLRMLKPKKPKYNGWRIQ